MLSVIVCTYNRDKYIYNLLQSIAKNTLSVEKYELIVVNNNSSDKTEEECNRFFKDYPKINFHYFIEQNQGLSYARNRGIKESNGDVVVFVDDDALVNTEFLSTYVDFFEKNLDVQGAGGRIVAKYECGEEPFWISYYTRMLITGCKDLGAAIRAFPKSDYPGGGNAAFRKSVFDQIGYFNVNLGRKGTSLIGAEEKDLYDKMAKLGMKIFYLPTAVLYHLIPDSKLTKEYFDRLTLGIGQSERQRTLDISRWKYVKRLFLEGIKWGGTIVFSLFYVLKLQGSKAKRLVLFRWNVTKGLIK